MIQTNEMNNLKNNIDLKCFAYALFLNIKLLEIHSFMDIQKTIIDSSTKTYDTRLFFSFAIPLLLTVYKKKYSSQVSMSQIFT